MKIWCYEDTQGWGQGLCSAALHRGYDARMFFTYDQPDEGYLFFHMHHHPQVRARHKRMMEHFATNARLRLIPDYCSAKLYDDKVEQARAYAKWMPETHVLRSPTVAKEFLQSDKMLPFPFISKAAEGASSYNVRLVHTMDAAMAEIRQAFSDRGIPAKYGQKQMGYLLWQEFIPDNDCDIRVIAIGRQRLVLRRFIRSPDRPFASGSGKLDHITELTDPKIVSAYEFANEFFKAEGLKWCGIDLVFDKVKQRWFLLETTVGWTLHGYFSCKFFPDGRMGTEVWEVTMDELEAGAFG